MPQAPPVTTTAPKARLAPGIAKRLNEQVAPESSNPTEQPTTQPAPIGQPTEKLKKKKWYTRIFNFLSWLVRIILCNSVPNNPKRKQEIEKLKDEKDKLENSNQKLKAEQDKLKKLIAQAIKQRDEQDKLKKIQAEKLPILGLNLNLWLKKK